MADKLTLQAQQEHLQARAAVGMARLGGGGAPHGRRRGRRRRPGAHAARPGGRQRPGAPGIGANRRAPTPLPPSFPLQSKVVGTGHADTTRYEWAVNMHRDTAASLVGNAHLTTYLAVAQSESAGRVRAQLLAGMVKPCGDRPKGKGDD